MSIHLSLHVYVSQCYSSLVLPENPFQGGAGASRRPRGALPVLQRHLSEGRGHPWSQVLLWAQHRRHGQSTSSFVWHVLLLLSLSGLVMWKNVGVAKPKISCGLNLVFQKGVLDKTLKRIINLCPYYICHLVRDTNVGTICPNNTSHIQPSTIIPP